MLYTKEEIARNNIQIIIEQEKLDLENASDNANEKNLQPKIQEKATCDTLLQGQAFQIKMHLDEVKLSTNQAHTTLNNIIVLDSHLQKKIEKLDVEHHSNKIELYKDAETLQAAQSRITEEQYDKALTTFEKSLQNQGEKLGTAEQRTAEAWHCEREARELREKVAILKMDLNTLSPDSTSHSTLQKTIQEAETAATALESKAKDIYESSLEQKESASHSLRNIRTDEARWIMAGAQSGVKLTDEEKEAQKNQKARLNAAILAGIQLKPKGKSEEKEEEKNSPSRTNFS